MSSQSLMGLGQLVLCHAQVPVSIVRSMEAAGETIDGLEAELAYNEHLVERDDDAP